MTQFDFYLLNLSFRAPDNLDIESLRESIEQLALDCDYIREHEETIYKHEPIYEEIIWENYQVMDILYTRDVQDRFGVDHYNYLQIIIDRSKETNLKNDEIIELLEEHSQDLINGLLCLHPVDEINSNYCVYNKNDWFDFHRYFLGLYPISEDWFSNCCSKYFPELCFHSDISGSLKTLSGGGLSAFSKGYFAQPFIHNGLFPGWLQNEYGFHNIRIYQIELDQVFPVWKDLDRTYLNRFFAQYSEGYFFLQRSARSISGAGPFSIRIIFAINLHLVQFFHILLHLQPKTVIVFLALFGTVHRCNSFQCALFQPPHWKQQSIHENQKSEKIAPDWE